MTPGTNKTVDPLAAIEDMLSSLCAPQSRADNGDNSMDDENQGENQRSKNYQFDDSNEDAPATPEKRSSRKNRQIQAHPRKKRSNASRPLPSRNRIRKPQKTGGRHRAAQIRDAKVPAHRDFDREGVQQDYDLGTSSDDRENMQLLNQMKRLAEQQLDVHKRKNDAMNVNAVNGMKRQTDQCVQKMKQIAGRVSSDIIARANELEEALPSKVNDQVAIAMSAVKSEKDGLAEFMSRAETFEDHVNKLLQQLQDERQKNMEKRDAEEEKLYADAKAAVASGQRLTSTLQEIDKMIDVGQCEEK